MRLNEKSIKFTTTDGKTPTFEQTANLKLVVNGKITEIGIEELFFNRPSINSGHVKGYSVLEQLQETSPKVFDKLVIGKDIEPLTVGFTDPKTGDMFYIKSVKVPTIYYQEDVSDDQVTEQLQKFYSPEAPASEEAPEDEKTEASTSPQVVEEETSDGDSSPTPLDNLKDEMTEAGYEHQHVNGYEVFIKEKRVPSVFKVDEKGMPEEVNIKETGFYVSEDGLIVSAEKPEPVIEETKEEPVAEEQKEEPAPEEQKEEETATEEERQEPSIEEQKEEPVNEEQKEETVEAEAESEVEEKA